jgi:Na+-translocating ferredoxin:NAD+ oxidoreductase RnfD subunit
MLKKSSIKLQLIIFLSCFAVYLAVRDKDPAFIIATLIAVAAAAACDAVIGFFKNKKFVITESSLISGLIIGYVLASDSPWWVFVFASAAAILSKHLLRTPRKHIFNPAAFGIFASILLFSSSTQWRGTYSWYIIVPAGLYFVYKIRKLELLGGYAFASLTLFAGQALIQHVPLQNIAGYFNYFFIFIMLIEPQTTPIKPRGKVIFGIGVGALIFILTGWGVRFDAELASLLALNLATPVLNKYSTG